MEVFIMPVMFTQDELKLLNEMSKGHPELNAKLNAIESGTFYQSYMESIKEDVLSNIDNGDYGEISDAQMEKICLRVANYDYGDYNEFIDSTIANIMGGA